MIPRPLCCDVETARETLRQSARLRRMMNRELANPYPTPDSYWEMDAMRAGAEVLRWYAEDEMERALQANLGRGGA